MEYSGFIKLLMTYKKSCEELSELHDIGIDLFEGKYKISDKLYSLLKITLDSHYNEKGVEWVEWFIFENDYGQKDWTSIPKFNKETGKIEENNDPIDAYGAKDENGDPICYSYDSLWEFIKQYKK